MKYIIDELGGACIFPDYLIHKDVGRAFTEAIVGAGFLSVDHRGRACCYGESISLNIKSREEDSQLVTEFLKHG